MIGGDIEATGPVRRRAVGDPEGPPARGRHRGDRHRRLSAKVIRAFRRRRLEASLDEKIASATAQGLRVHIVSQFSFAAGPAS